MEVQISTRVRLKPVSSVEFPSILALYFEATMVPATAANCRQTATAAQQLITVYIVRADCRPSRGGVGLIPLAAKVFCRRRRRTLMLAVEGG